MQKSYASPQKISLKGLQGAAMLNTATKPQFGGGPGAMLATLTVPPSGQVTKVNTQADLFAVADRTSQTNLNNATNNKMIRHVQRHITKGNTVET